jgi:hypothetical protein
MAGARDASSGLFLSIAPRFCVEAFRTLSVSCKWQTLSPFAASNWAEIARQAHVAAATVWAASAEIALPSADTFEWDARSER